MFQSPSLRGSGRFGACGGRSGEGPGAFQSPSLRGSGRFRRASSQHRGSGPGFNPLHCGAVVASPPGLVGSRTYSKVSIPFIAGQWSLPGRPAKRGGAVAPFQSPSLRGSGRFAQREAEARKAAERVSIPFIAGQWSLPAADDAARDQIQRFQSPSLRGSGRFTGQRRGASPPPWSFNPLHCGAVVASARQRKEKRMKECFNPLHCGAVVASR